MNHSITLFISGGSWMARHSDPSIRAIFGVDVLPTAFTAAAPAADVLAHIQRRNPGINVSLAAPAPTGDCIPA